VKSAVNSAPGGASAERGGAGGADHGAGRTISHGQLPKLVGYLIRKAHSGLFQSFTEALDDLGLAPGQYNALLLIGLNPGLSQMALADASGIDRTTVVPITERFAKAGWVRRTRRTEDRRVYCLRLTPAGEAVLKSAQPLIDAHEKEFVAALRPGERALLRSLLARIADLEAAKPAEVLDFGPLPTLVGYQLKRAYSYLFRTFMAAFKHLQLAPGQYSALVLIGLNPGLSQLDLAQAVGLDGSTLVPITNRFVKLGWIRRARRKSDRRVYALRITPAGQAVLDEARPLIAARERHLASVLNPEQRGSLIDMLSRITDEQPQDPPSGARRSKS